MGYLDGTRVAVCQTRDECDTAFQAAVDKEEPLVRVHEKRKYARVYVDMLPAGRTRLNEQGIERAREIIGEVVNEAEDLPEQEEATDYSVGRTVVYVSSLLIPEANECARRLETVVRDQSNQLTRSPSHLEIVEEE